MIILGLGGYAGSGKDTTAGHLTHDWGFRRFAFADALRRMSEIMDPALDVRDLPINDPAYLPLSRILLMTGGWDDAKRRFPSVRSWLQRLGTEAGRDVLGESIWVDTVFRKINAVEEKRLSARALPELSPAALQELGKGGRYVITDVRVPNELRIVQRHKGLTAWVRRPGAEPVNTHASDNVLGPDDFDIIIENDGDLVHLRNTVAVVATSLDLT